MPDTIRPSTQNSNVYHAFGIVSSDNPSSRKRDDSAVASDAFLLSPSGIHNPGDYPILNGD